MSPQDSTEPTNGPSRRTLLVASAGTALGVTVVAGCGGGGSGTATDTPTPSGGGSTGLAKVSDVPVGGAVSAQTADGKPVIVAQPKAGDIVAFSAICTHMGCTVAPQGSILKCPCHGSTYDLATGDNTGGPAPSPLAKIDVLVKGGEVVQA